MRATSRVGGTAVDKDFSFKTKAPKQYQRCDVLASPSMALLTLSMGLAHVQIQQKLSQSCGLGVVVVFPNFRFWMRLLKL
jgi:hypothetical protein